MIPFTVFLVFGCVTLSKYFVRGEFITDQKFGEQKFYDKTVRNDVWGKGAGYQKMTATSGSTWCVDCSHGSTGGIKAYPHSGYIVNKTLSNIKYLVSRFEANVVQKPGVLAYALAHDIWLQGHKYEVMLWMDYCGEVGPIGSVVRKNVTTGGHCWKVYKGHNGYNHVYSFVDYQKNATGRVVVKEILEWINSEGWFQYGLSTMVDEIQFGFEITSTPQFTKMCLNKFNVILI